MHVLMAKNIPVCRFDLDTGEFLILAESFMPYNLHLTAECGSLQEKIANINAIHHWCADRVLSLDRCYAKQILNELGLPQSQNDSVKAKISLACRSISLQDCFWVKEEGDPITWDNVNLFTHHFSDALIPVALRGGSATIKNKHWRDISQELSTHGTFAKAWGRTENEIILYKADDVCGNETLREVNASRILDCFDIPHVQYALDEYDGKRVSVCTCMTDEQTSMVPFRHFQEWCYHQKKNPIEEVKRIDADGYYKMNVMTYLIGNSDNHDGNWGFYRDNETGKLTTLHPLFDFNYAFDNYSSPDGGWCIPECITFFNQEEDGDIPFQATKTQKEAALEAMQHVTITQLKPVTGDMFLSVSDFEVFRGRCRELGLQLL